jgi:hypothetical protein
MNLAPPGGAAVILSFALAVLAWGCGGSDGSMPVAQQGLQLNEPINLADCRDWNAGTVEERLGTIRAIRAFLGTPVPGTGTSREALDDEQAYDLFEGWCQNEYARGFRLYKLYARAQAFSGAPAAE